MRTAKYCLIKQMNWSEYIDRHNILGVVTGYNIYVNSFQDACSYIARDLLKYYADYCKNTDDRWYDRWRKLSGHSKYILLPGEYSQPKNLRAFKYIYAGYEDYYLKENGDVKDINFLPNENLLLSNFISKTIREIADGAKIDIFYSFPIKVTEIKVKAMWNKQHPESHHLKSIHYALPRKRELALSHDLEVREYLDARDMFKGNFWRHKGIRHNRHSYVPGDWKHCNKCRKQWAKNIENPSYEKLSRAVWKQELEEIETGAKCT